MIEAHVAGLAGLGLTGLLDGEGVARVAGVARGDAEPAPLGGQALHLLGGLEADLVTTAAALHPLGHRHRLGVNGGHGLHGRPGERVLALWNCATCFSWQVAQVSGVGMAGLGRVIRRLVVAPVAGGALDARGAVFARLPVGDDAGGLLAVTLDTGVIGGERGGEAEESQKQCESHGTSKRPRNRGPAADETQQNRTP